MAAMFQDQLDCSSGRGCSVGNAVIQVGGRVRTLEDEHAVTVTTISSIFDEINKIRWFFVTTLLSVLLMGGGAILAFMMKK